MVSREKGIFTVHEFTQAVRSVLTNGHLNDVWIRGEISNCTNHNSGHRYFTLKDKSSQLPCVMFKWYNQNLRFEPEHGMNVMVFGDIDVYEQRGRYQLNVRMIRPDGVGELFKAYEHLKNKLALEGLFSPEHKKMLPRFPRKIGVATAETGAAIHDIVTVLQRRYPVSIVFIPTLVQGEYAAGSIARSLEALNRTDVDVIILGRGGGSMEDLWAFNEEIVARAIFNSKIPVISAVGHETDYTIADFVADVRAPTPSAAAAMAVPDREEVFQKIRGQSERMIQIQRRYIHERISRISDLEKSIGPGIFAETITLSRHRIEHLSKRNTLCIHRVLETKNALFKSYAEKLDAVSPLGTLSRGYSIAFKLPEKTVVSSIHDVKRNDLIHIMVNDGKIDCLVNDTGAYQWK